MRARAMRSTSRRTAALTLMLSVSVAALTAQTVIKLPKNRYTPEQDVQLGREAAAEVRQQYPLINEPRITKYLSRLGDQLVAAAPPEFKQPVYEYSFTPVNLKEINAFALPGGPMFVHRGMFDAAASEGEVVGVMAHELSHVLLRHGTANASKAQNPWLQLGQIAGVVGGAVVGGAAGSAIAQGSQFGLGTLLLRYSRDFEKQADLLGAQIMARAGYDPRALARMFETIERETRSSGGGGPQWMSSHPNPGNRTQYITTEADSLAIMTGRDEREFEPIKTAFASLPPAKSMADLAGGRGSGGEGAPSVGTPGQPVPPPSGQYRALNGGGVFQAVGAEQLDQPVVEERNQGGAAERLRHAQRPDGVQPRRRVRRDARLVARPARRHRGVAQRRWPGQSRFARRRDTAGDPDIAAIGAEHAACQPVAAWRP